MRLEDIVLEETENKHIRQEKFAKENFIGVNEIGKELLDAVKQIKDKISKAEKLKNSNMDSYFDEINNIKKEFEPIGTLFTVLSIKLTTSFAHSLNSKSTKTLKNIIRFLDKHGVGDKVFNSNMRSIVSMRSIHSDNILTLSALVASQIDDLDFIKELEAFAEKNKGRENIYDDFTYEISSYGVFSNNMKRIDEQNRIAFEALINGSERVYRHLSGDTGLSPDYILKYITNNDGFWKRERLKPHEVSNVIKLEPKFIDDIVTNMPENLPPYLVDIFIF